MSPWNTFAVSSGLESGIFASLEKYAASCPVKSGAMMRNYTLGGAVGEMSHVGVVWVR